MKLFAFLFSFTFTIWFCLHFCVLLWVHTCGTMHSLYLHNHFIGQIRLPQVRNYEHPRQVYPWALSVFDSFWGSFKRRHLTGPLIIRGTTFVIRFRCSLDYFPSHIFSKFDGKIYLYTSWSVALPRYSFPGPLERSFFFSTPSFLF